MQPPFTRRGNLLSLLVLLVLCAVAPLAEGVSSVAAAGLTVSPSSLTLSSSQQSVQLNGCGFTPGSQVTVEVLAPGGTVVNGSVGYGIAGSNGCIYGAYPVPPLPGTGTFTVQASDPYNNVADATLLVTAAQTTGTFQLSVSTATVGQQVTASNACGFVSGNSVAASIVDANGTVYGLSNVSGTPLGNGCYNVSFVVPSLPDGSYTVTFTDGITTDTAALQVTTPPSNNGCPGCNRQNGQGFHHGGRGNRHTQQAQTTGTFQLSVSTATVGQQVTASNACGFVSGNSVAASIVDASGTVYGLSNVSGTSLGNGCYNVSFVVPSLPAGSYTVTFADGSNTDTGALQVTTPPSNYGCPGNGRGHDHGHGNQRGGQCNNNNGRGHGRR